MLRMMFGEERRQDEDLLLATNQAIIAFCKKLRSVHPCSGEVEARWIRLDLWANGLTSALNELEQSVYCATKYSILVSKTFEEEMAETERDNYDRYNYYYKNALIRIFSILDKTGYFLDTLLEAETARVKHRFSYFTVLRQLHQTHKHTYLEQLLYNLKVDYQVPLNRLRKKRNLEIHSMNAELVDDVWRTRACFADRHLVEPIQVNMNDLNQGYQMVCESLKHIFTYVHSVLE
jgi:hypothetical protein